MERESSKECSVSFCGQTRAFRYEIVFRGIQPCFLHGGSECLACFEPTKAARFLKKLEVHSVYKRSMVKESTFLKGNFCIHKGFMDVFYIFKNIPEIIAHGTPGSPEVYFNIRSTSIG